MRSPVFFLSIVSACSLTNLGFAQDSLADASEVFAANHFTMGVHAGYMSSYSQQTLGSETIERYRCTLIGMNFKYGLNFNEDYSLELGAGFGMHSTSNYTDPNGNPGFAPHGFWYYNSTLSADFVFRIPLNERLLLRLKGGVGLWSLGKDGFHSSSTISYADTLGSPEYNTSSEIKFNGSKPAFRAGLGFSRILSNNDVLTLDLGAELFTQPIFSGNYTVRQNGITTGTGDIRSGLTSFNLGLGYTFTYVDRDRKVQSHLDKGLTGREAKRARRAEKRFLPEDNLRIGVSIGMFASTTEVISDEGSYYMDHWGGPSFLPEVMVEKGITRNFFATGALNVTQYWFTDKGRDEYGWSSSDAFESIQLLMGGGYHIIGPRNYRFIDLSAGIGLNFNTASKGLNGWGGSSIGSSPDSLTFEANHLEYTVRRLFATVHLAANKDFQVTKSLCISLTFRQQFGFQSTSEQYHTYTHNGDGPYKATLALKGRGSAYMIGVKYTLRH